MQVYPNRFSDNLQKGLQSFYLVFGDEPQQKLQALEQLRIAARKQGFDERQSLLADGQFNWHQLLEATQSLSLFSSRIFIELELPEGKPGAEGSKILVDLSTKSHADTIIVIHGGKIGKDVQKTKWFLSLDKQGVYVPCYPLEGNQLQQWISRQLLEAGLNNSNENCKLLIDYCEGNLLAAKQEIEKLALLFPDGQLTAQQIEQAVVDQSRFNVFQLVDVLLAGDAQKSIKMLYRLESEGIEPNIVLWALVREWQTLYELRHCQKLNQPINWNKHRIWQNRQSLYLSALSRLNDMQLQQMQKKLTIMDHAFKQSQVTRPYVELCHLCMLFIPMPLDQMALA
jgi:DNA polymerase III subunit delta